MIDSEQLLEDLTKLLKTLEKDLHQQVTDHADMRERLMADYEAARKVGRTRDTFETWSEEPLTQGAAAWILGTVFIRFLEDNALMEPMLSGVGARHKRAQQEQQHYVQQHPTHSGRQYLEHLFGRLRDIPAAAALFDCRHNPLWRLPLSADAARTLVEFWQRIDPDSGQVTHDFSDAALDTRFLGDLYQDLSEPVRKRYALLQTPRFVAKFILDRTLTPAIETFGYREVCLIDPTCGSGHFLLDAFDRLLSLAQEHEPGKDVRVIVQDVLSRVVGLDINAYAVAIAAFRLTVAAVQACGIGRISDAPAFGIGVAAADSLLHGPRFNDDGAVQMSVLPDNPSHQYYFAEDDTRVKALLGRRYHAVVGNPPYITVKDPALDPLYRQRYGACYRQYSLVVPFMERFFELALPPAGDDMTRAGYVGLIVANSFMKREFGSRLIEDYLPLWDLTHVVDTSGAYIPGHGTPTVILFGRHRKPQSDAVRVVMGIRGEPSTPEEPAKALVWTAILDQIDKIGSESAFVSVTDLPRVSLYAHPWSIGGGGASELKELLDTRGTCRLSQLVDTISSICITREDDAYLFDKPTLDRQRIASRYQLVSVEGEKVRDWSIVDPAVALFPYSKNLKPVSFADGREVHKFLWPYKELLWRRKELGGDHRKLGRTWWEWNRFLVKWYRKPLSIAFAFVATHNHFILDRGGRVFNRSAPVLKLKDGATDDDHIALIGLLNSSTACFWMKQVFSDKGNGGIGGGIGDEMWERRFEHDATKLWSVPVVSSGAATELARALTKLGVEAADLDTGSILLREDSTLRETDDSIFGEMVTLQEELDWEMYTAHGLTLLSYAFQRKPPSLDLGQRAFEIVMARRMAAEDMRTAWFERHGSTPTTDLPDHWPADYRVLVEKRIALIESDRNIGLIEQPEYKRRWNREPFAHRLKRHRRSWLGDRLESAEYRRSVGVTSAVKLADHARRDADFMRVAEAYATDPAFDVLRLVDELVRDESVPFLPLLRYKESGLQKRQQWERVWNLQRQEDVGVEVGDIPVPPKYTSADFQSGPVWGLRGKLDVPKERFVSYPGCERDADGSLPIAWAGWDHAQQARALGAYYMQIKTEEGTVPNKLVPLLAGLLELLPWIRQWHGGTDNDFGLDLGDSYADFVNIEARALGFTVEQVRAWKPEGKAKKGKKPKQA